MPIDEAIGGRLQLLQGISRDDLLPSPTPEALDAMMAAFAPVDGWQPPPASTEEVMAFHPDGQVRVRVYRPPSGKPEDVGLVWLHGGGFAGGDLEMAEADGIARELIARTRATIISVDYRLARGEVHFPAPHDDAHSAWLWAAAGSEELGIAPGRLLIGGASAGANLATGVALRLRDEGRPQPNRLLLAYPTLHLDYVAPCDPPVELAAIPPLLRFESKAIRGLYENYLGGADPDPYAVPGMADPTGLAPTVILTCEYDDLRGSGEAFAKALRAAGTEVTERFSPGVTHGHLNIAGLPANDQALRFLASSLNEAADRRP